MSGRPSAGVEMRTNRIEAFSDGVFAIAITLLTLNLRAPADTTHLGAGLVALWPSYLASTPAFSIAAGSIAPGGGGLTHGQSPVA